MMWIVLVTESVFKEVAQSLRDLRQLCVLQGIKRFEGCHVGSSQLCEEYSLSCTSREILYANDV